MQTSQFLRGKGQVVEEYQRTRRKMFSAVAGRGFSYEPGFLFDLHNELEVDTKFKLSTLNYQILEQMVQQELKRKGLDYDLEYKQAAVAWEVEKTNLLSDWEKELADIKHESFLDNNVLVFYALEVSKRGALLIDAKAVIELEIEGYRQQIELLDKDTSDYEVQLAQAKIITAQKKLEMIPYIEQLIAVENQMIDKELLLLEQAQILAGKENQVVSSMQSIADNDMILADVESSVIVKQNQILTKDREIIDISTQLLDSVEYLYEIQNSILTYDTQISQKQVSLANYDMDLSDKRMVEATARLGLLTSKGQLLQTEQSIIDGKSILLDNEQMAALLNAGILTQINGLITQDQFIANAETLNIQLKDSLLQAEQQVVGKETQILPILQNISTLEQQNITIQQQVVATEAGIATNYAGLIMVEQQIAQAGADIALIAQDVVDKASDVLTNSFDLLLKHDSLNVAKYNTIASSQNLYQANLQKQGFVDQLIQAEGVVVDYSIANLQPALVDLVQEINNYIANVQQQILIQQQIIDANDREMVAANDTVQAQANVLNQKQSLIASLTALESSLAALISYKTTTLQGAYANYDVASNQDILEKQQQARLKQQIADVKKDLAQIVMPQKLNYEIDKLDEEIDKQSELVTLKTSEAALKQQDIQNRIDMANKEAFNFTIYKTAWDTVKQVIDTMRQNSFSTVKNNRQIEMATDFDIRIDNQTTLETQRRSTQSREAYSKINYIQQKAAIQTNVQGVTARLNHLLI